MKDIENCIQAIDELSQKQVHAEKRRQLALAEIQASQRDIALSQDLLHASVQRIAQLDDATHNCRNTQKEKKELLDKLQKKLDEEKKRMEQLEKELETGEKHEQKRLCLMQDLQRRLLESGILPEDIARLQNGETNIAEIRRGRDKSRNSGREKGFMKWKKK